ncbi:MAG TPA: HNH endonuclease [Anaerolineales bacterium]|nr:HNH endonuclease [Anaerolineales bacterium]
MPRLSTPFLIKSIIDALSESNASAVLISSPNVNPRRFVVQAGQNMFEMWVYIWTLTHGGGAARPVSEYRIQITGIKPPLELNPFGPTLLIGFEPNLQCFAGFDLSKHRTFSTRSPSIQIPITILHNALQDGFSFITKGNEEIAIGFRPDQFLAYALNSELLHAQGTDLPTVNLLSRAASLQEITQDEIEQIPAERQRVVQTLSRLSRDTSFRRKVTTAYEYRCAVTRMQLRLIDAAHILPVGIEGSNDEVANGLSLSPTYHRAYDRGLIYLDEDFVMRINREKEQELIHVGLAGGLQDFKQYLDRRIHLPLDLSQRPNIEFIRAANHFRGIE